MIHAIGDSFTFGDELDNQEQAWPAVLSGLLNQAIINQGKSASGNSRMVKRTIDAVIESANMIIIGWSGVGRQEFADEIGIYDLWAGRSFRAFQNDPTHRIDMIKYMTAYDAPKYYYAKWLRQVILVQSFCKLNHVPCVMFVACDANESHRQYAKEFQHLVDKIDHSMFVDTMSKSVAQWCYGLPYGPNGHPLVEGHQRIAEKINEHIRNISRVS
jgi:hypothetical protein